MARKHKSVAELVIEGARIIEFAKTAPTEVAANILNLAAGELQKRNAPAKRKKAAEPVAEKA